jgi:hypothetical protein
MARYYYRKGDDPGIKKVRPWIEKWYGDSSGLRIDEQVLSVDSLVAQGEVSTTEQYLAAACKRQSSLHAFLKLIAHNCACQRM